MDLIVMAAAGLFGAGAEGANSTMSIVGMVALWVLMFVGLYFIMIRPQKKQNEKMEQLQNSIEPGDSIMTTSGFYGTVIGVDNEEGIVIVEFGNNKNCRIPMHRKAIAEVEKAGGSSESEESKN